MDTIREAVIHHYREMACRMPEYSPTRMAELAPGVVAVEDKSGECDAFFNERQWQFRDPELWEQCPGFNNPLLRNAGLQILQGVGRVPRVSTVEEMVNFAKKHLFSIGGATWHDTPQFFPI